MEKVDIREQKMTKKKNGTFQNCLRYGKLLSSSIFNLILPTSRRIYDGKIYFV